MRMILLITILLSLFSKVIYAQTQEDSHPSTHIYLPEENKEHSKKTPPSSDRVNDKSTLNTPKDREFQNVKPKEPKQNKEEKKSEEDKEKKDNKEEKKEKEKEDKDKDKKQKEDEKPWFLGTLLAIFGENIDPGKLLVEPTIFISRIYGLYDAHSSLVRGLNFHLYSFLLSLETGITKNVDIAVDLTRIYAHSDFGDASDFGDTQIQLGFQVARDKKGSRIPNFRILASQYFPTGKFENLNPLLKLTDVTGSGAYALGLGIVLEKIFYNIPNHPYKLNFNATIIHAMPVFVTGLSIYGGGPDSFGLAQPGTRFIGNFSYEYKFNKNWGWGIDAHYEYQANSSFHLKRGSALFAGIPSSYSFSLAPEIEYNFNANFALSAALWYSLAGRNTFAFFNGAFLISFLF